MRQFRDILYMAFVASTLLGLGATLGCDSGEIMDTSAAESGPAPAPAGVGWVDPSGSGGGSEGIVPDGMSGGGPGSGLGEPIGGSEPSPEPGGKEPDPEPGDDPADQTPEGDDGNDDEEDPPGVPEDDGADDDEDLPGLPGAGLSPGAVCACDADCADVDGYEGACVTGICMTRAGGACSSRGTRQGCPGGSRCWPLRNFDDSPVCWPDCDTYTCDGTCDDDGSCAPTDEMNCDAACGAHCTGDATERPCSPENPQGQCASGQTCLEGACAVVCSIDAPEGYCPGGFVCSAGACLPTDGCGHWRCELGAACDDIVQVGGSTDPASAEADAAGYFVDTHLDYSYLRQDLVLLLRWATCQMKERFPNIEPIGLADLSQGNGRTPGHDVGDERHPSGTHQGSDLDIAYYQTDGVNDAQIICGDGTDDNSNSNPGQHNDGYFCTTESNIVDIQQQTWFLALLAVHPDWRVVGVDVTLADDIQAEVERLHQAQLITPEARARILGMGYGSSGGWQYHHHHIHVSFH